MRHKGELPDQLSGLLGARCSDADRLPVAQELQRGGGGVCPDLGVHPIALLLRFCPRS